jgi:hypothetical protein
MQFIDDDGQIKVRDLIPGDVIRTDQVRPPRTVKTIDLIVSDGDLRIGFVETPLSWVVDALDSVEVESLAPFELDEDGVRVPARERPVPAFKEGDPF